MLSVNVAVLFFFSMAFVGGYHQTDQQNGTVWRRADKTPPPSTTTTSTFRATCLSLSLCLDRCLSQRDHLFGTSPPSCQRDVISLPVLGWEIPATGARGDFKRRTIDLLCWHAGKVLTHTWNMFRSMCTILN